MEREAFERWLQRDYATAYRTTCLILRDRADAQDTVQEAYLRLWRFRSSVPLEDGESAWLYRVVVNACMTRLRNERSRVGGNDAVGALDKLTGSEVVPKEAAEQGQRAANIVRAVADLPDQLRVPLILRFWAGLSEQEIAVAIDRRPGTVKSRLHAGRQRLALSAWAIPLEEMHR